ncbi:MAG TPA: serine protease, partial [Methylocella sp.]|nr:serine protease [Methylocella sp.]
HWKLLPLCFFLSHCFFFRSQLWREGICFFAAAFLITAGLTQPCALAKDESPYIVDGLALGGPVAPKSAAYLAYTCRPSNQFKFFTWCQRRRTEDGKFGTFVSVNSILHASSNETVYVSRFIEPAYFGPGDIEREIERLSKRFGAPPSILEAPRRKGAPAGIIASWGKVSLTPLGAENLGQLATGQSIAKGMLFDFLGNFKESARLRLPIFQLGGGAGYVWGARFDENGWGALRMTAIDSSRFRPSFAVAQEDRIDSPPEPQPRSGRSASRAAPPEPSGRVSSGTGFFVTKQGHVLTNNHVVENCGVIRVFVNPGEWSDARILAEDATNDLALLTTDLAPPRVATLRTGSRLGEFVAAFGYPHLDILATSGNFTQGNVTALAGIGDDSRYLQISVPVQAGNSGGPLLDQSGNLAGVVTSKLNVLKIAEASGDFPQNVNFALKASVVASFLDNNGIPYATGVKEAALKPEDLADRAKSMSVIILCK